MSDDSTPSLASVLRGAIEAHMSDVHTAMPGRVETFDPATQKATVQPLVRRPYLDEDGERIPERLPVVAGVPVMFPGSGGFSLTWPVAVGDVGLLVFASCSLDRWLARGGEVDPADERRHTLSDAVFIPGLRPFSAPGPATHATAMVITAPGEIHVGGTSALALLSELVALRDHVASLPVGGTGSAVLVGPALPATPTGTTKLKGS